MWQAGLVNMKKTVAPPAQMMRMKTLENDMFYGSRFKKEKL